MESGSTLALFAQGTETGAANGTDNTVQTPGVLPDIPYWLVDIAASILVLVLAVMTARLLTRLLSRRIAQYFKRPSLTRVALGGVRLGIYLFGFLIILRINGLDLGNIALSVTVFSAVIGVVLAPIVGSIISGMFLLADQPYEIGDMIGLPERDRRGFVEDITLRYTKLFTLDNTFLVVPNGKMRDRDVINYSAEDTRVRRTLDIVITYESDLATARKRIEDSARAVEGVIAGGPAIRIGGARYPAAPDCLIRQFGDHGIELRLRYWVNEPYRMQTIQSAVQTNIWEALENENVEIAYPHSHLVFDETSGQLQVSASENGAQPGDHTEQPTPDGDHTPSPSRSDRAPGGSGDKE